MQKTKRSALELEREAAAYTSDVGSSLASSVESVQDSEQEYETDAILAQRMHFDEDGDDSIQYLVKFTDYPMHRCEWLRKEQLSCPEILHAWKKRRKELGTQKLQELIERNQKEFEGAQAKAEAAKNRRREKRAKLRKEAESKKEKMGVARPVHPATRSLSTPASKVSKRESKSAMPSGRRRKVVLSSDDDESDGKQSSEESSSESEPLFVKRSKVTKSNPPRARHGANSGVDSRHSSPTTRRIALADVPPIRPSEHKIPQHEQRTASPTAKDAPDGHTPKQVSSTKQGAPEASPSAAKSNTEPTLLVMTGRSEPTPTGPVSKTDKPPSGVPAPIKMVNEPKKPLRKEWNTENKHFTTLKYRGIAEKRSRIEGTPDFTQLEFVNGSPSSFPKRAADVATRTDDPYGRREPGRQRLRELVQDAEPNPPATGIPLQPYEKGKLPLACYDWKYHTCKLTPEDCRYLHREQDEDGKPLETSAWDGRLLPKYKTPRETCFYWLREEKGCQKPAAVCKYAHENTGFLPGPDGQAVQIDPRQRPVSERRLQDSPKHRGLTCYFWLRGNGCARASECTYAHENTGWLKIPNLGTTKIDPNESPRHMESYMPIHKKTCFFWNMDLCRNTEDRCLGLHRYTGQVAAAPVNYVYPPGYRFRYRDDPNTNAINKSAAPQRSSLEKDYEVAPDTTNRTNNRSSSPPKETEKTLPVVATVDMKRKIEAAFQVLDFEEMFTCNGDQYNDVIAERNALILYDRDEHLVEHELITRWLVMQHVNVYKLWVDGMWDAFKQLIVDGGSGIVIAHPDFDGYANLPGFGDVLRGTVRLWSVGYQEGADYSIWNPNASLKRSYDRFPIFPHGGIIYMTDDVFEKKPQLALKIVELFFAMIERGRKVDSDVIPGMYVNDGILLWRLGVRPELLKWIGDTCLNHETEIVEGDPDYVSLEKLYLLLTDSGYIEPDGTIERPEDNRRLDFFPIVSARKGLAEEIGLYYDARKLSQHDANTDMVHHYSGLVVVERRLYRQFFVVHTEPDEVNWKTEVTNIDEVMTPEKCIEYFEGEPKGNRFDNYEWSYPEKRKDYVSD